ncbi:MAG: hypothetical protein ACREGF_05800, partial [Candidatus Saccharimonadales bacterium]
VVYMQDGRIVHDETTKIGEVAPTARRVMYSVPKITEEDDLAGVSALMKAIPGHTNKEPASSSAAKNKKSKSRSVAKRKATNRNKS